MNYPGEQESILTWGLTCSPPQIGVTCLSAEAGKVAGAGQTAGKQCSPERRHGYVAEQPLPLAGQRVFIEDLPCVRGRMGGNRPGGRRRATDHLGRSTPRGGS